MVGWFCLNLHNLFGDYFVKSHFMRLTFDFSLWTFN